MKLYRYAPLMGLVLAACKLSSPTSAVRSDDPPPAAPADAGTDATGCGNAPDPSDTSWTGVFAQSRYAICQQYGAQAADAAFPQGKTVSTSYDTDVQNVTTKLASDFAPVAQMDPPTRTGMGTGSGTASSTDGGTDTSGATAGTAGTDTSGATAGTAGTDTSGASLGLDDDVNRRNPFEATKLEKCELGKPCCTFEFRGSDPSPYYSLTSILREVRSVCGDDNPDNTDTATVYCCGAPSQRGAEIACDASNGRNPNVARWMHFTGVSKLPGPFAPDESTRKETELPETPRTCTVEGQACNVANGGPFAAKAVPATNWTEQINFSATGTISAEVSASVKAGGETGLPLVAKGSVEVQAGVKVTTTGSITGGTTSTFSFGCPSDQIQYGACDAVFQRRTFRKKASTVTYRGSLLQVCTWKAPGDPVVEGETTDKPPPGSTFFDRNPGSQIVKDEPGLAGSFVLQSTYWQGATDCNVQGCLKAGDPDQSCSAGFFRNAGTVCNK